MIYDKDEEVELFDISKYMEDDETPAKTSVRRGTIEDSRRYTADNRKKSGGVKRESARTAEKNTAKKKVEKKKINIARYLGQTCATIGVTVLALAVFLYGVMAVLCWGPSKTAKTQFVLSVQETSAIGFLAKLFCSDEEIATIKEENSVKDTNETTDSSLVVIDTENNEDVPDLQIIDVKGATYKGKLMIVKDPSRLFVGTIGEFTQGNGMVVSAIAKRYDAIAGINGGEFVDGETTWTGMPVGLVMVDGKVLNGDEGATYHVTGITDDYKLVLGNMTIAEARENNVRDCVSISSSIGPFLVVNGNAQDVSGIGGGINPRTAIGQTADGSILLLAIDGRMANSLGASFSDVQDVMLEYGAVNASVMDGGTSTQMYYNGAVINTPYSPFGPRACPTAFLIK
jgi:exopolysaccharide biosynthesis protein